MILNIQGKVVWICNVSWWKFCCANCVLLHFVFCVVKVHVEVWADRGGRIMCEQAVSQHIFDYFWMLFENTIGSCPGFVPGTPKKMDLVVTCRYDSSVFLFVKEDRSYIRNNNHRFLSVNPITSVNFSIHQEPPKHWQSCGHECSIPLDSQNYAGIWNV